MKHFSHFLITPLIHRVTSICNLILYNFYIIYKSTYLHKCPQLAHYQRFNLCRKRGFLEKAVEILYIYTLNRGFLAENQSLRLSTNHNHFEPISTKLSQLLDTQRVTPIWLPLEISSQKNFLGSHLAFSASFLPYPSHPFALSVKRLRLCVGRIFVVTQFSGGYRGAVFEVRHRKLRTLKKFSEFSSVSPFCSVLSLSNYNRSARFCFRFVSKSAKIR